jgi:hypothetical protein
VKFPALYFWTFCLVNGSLQFKTLPFIISPVWRLIHWMLSLSWDLAVGRELPGLSTAQTPRLAGWCRFWDADLSPGPVPTMLRVQCELSPGEAPGMGITWPLCRLTSYSLATPSCSV